MSDTGWKSPGTVSTSNVNGGTHNWANINNIKNSNNSYASTSHYIEFEDTYYLKATDFNFDIPEGATIDGVEIGIERYGDIGGEYKDSEIKLIKSDGSISSTNKSESASWSSIEGYVYFGGSTDKWGETLSASDINDEDFGVAISAEYQLRDEFFSIYVDHIQIKVYYTESSTPTVGTKHPLPAFKRP
jgi:hypothetical protein